LTASPEIQLARIVFVRPTAGTPQDEGTYGPAKAAETSVALGAKFDQGVPFQNYVGSDGLVDWSKRHVCKHEDVGLMAPIEVWEPQVVSQRR
jgi:hypothetical protein